MGILFELDIENAEFNYGYIGDCYSAVIRNNSMRVFTECQTKMISENKGKYSSDEIRFQICNYIEHPCGYGVWDGNKNAMDFVRYGTISLRAGDVIYYIQMDLLKR